MFAPAGAVVHVVDGVSTGRIGTGGSTSATAEPTAFGLKQRFKAVHLVLFDRRRQRRISAEDL
jgi:hypothetical protein